MSKKLIAEHAKEMSSKCDKLVSDMRKKPYELTRDGQLKIIKSLGNEFWKLYIEIDKIKELESKKCEKCGELDSSYVEKINGIKKEICRKCKSVIDAERARLILDQKLNLFKKRLIDFFKKQDCKYVEFPITWKYFWKNYGMSKYEFNEIFMLIKIHPRGIGSLELHDQVTDKSDYYGMEKSIQITRKEFEDKKEYYQYYKLWTISMVQKQNKDKPEVKK